jgi:hypothetical protein
MSICFEVDAKVQKHESSRVFHQTGEVTIFRVGQIVRYRGPDAQRQYTVRSMVPPNTWGIADIWTNTIATFEHNNESLQERIESVRQDLEHMKKVVQDKEQHLVELEAQLASQQEAASLSEVVVK